jgi:large subunit ribosomal protein L2
MHTNIGKAGTNINTGRRMTVRGVAMNAIDHPHGGGRGKTSGGPRPLSPWGKITKKRKTVSKKLRAKKLKIRFR